VTALLRGLAGFAALIVVASNASAQGRYRVLVGAADTPQMLLIEFSPCIPAETSACGAFVTRVIDTSTDTAYGTKPAIVVKQTAPDSGGAIAVQEGMLNVTTFVRDARVAAVGKLIADPKRTATAVAISADSRYAFAVLEAKNPGELSQVRMIDLSTRSGIASIGISVRPLGIAIAP
jgi:hypothetical protein